MGECHDLRVNARTVDASVVHRPKAVGTSLMEHIAELTHLHDEMHTVTGAIAILLMFVHALWAIWTYVKGTPIEKRHFNRFSIVVWCIWLIPYLIGVYLGMRLHV